MKKLPSSKHERLKPVKLYLDELEQIHEVLVEISKHIEIKAEGYQLNNLREIAELKRPYLTDLELTSSEPYVSITLKASSARIYISKDDATSIGAFESVKLILHSVRQPLIVRFIRNGNLSVYCLGGACGLVLLDIFRGTMPSLVLFLPVTLGVAWAFYANRAERRWHSIIVAEHRIAAPSFWQRNKDRILVGIITAIVTAIVTVVASILSVA